MNSWRKYIPKYTNKSQRETNQKSISINHLILMKIPLVAGLICLNGLDVGDEMVGL